MTLLVVDAGARTLRAGRGPLPCAIGRAGTMAAADKREGDGCTPLGRWPVRGLLLRPDRLSHVAGALPWRWLRPDDGWSDDPDDPAYNRPVRLPHRFGAESLWRDDDAYDAIVVLGYNDAPPLPGHGSAIFLHALPASGVTAGCVALAHAALLALLPLLAPTDMLEVRA